MLLTMTTKVSRVLAIVCHLVCLGASYLLPLIPFTHTHAFITPCSPERLSIHHGLTYLRASLLLTCKLLLCLTTFYSLTPVNPSTRQRSRHPLTCLSPPSSPISLKNIKKYCNPQREVRTKQSSDPRAVESRGVSADTNRFAREEDNR